MTKDFKDFLKSVKLYFTKYVKFYLTKSHFCGYNISMFLTKSEQI